MQWTLKSELLSENVFEDYLGFVYLITNTENGRKYVGKKLFKNTRTKKVKGRRKRTIKESDWKDYYGSNKELLDDVKRLGPEKFKREILHLCKSKGECNYLELKEQILREVLESEEYYNTWIYVRIHKAHLKRIECY